MMVRAVEGAVGKADMITDSVDIIAFNTLFPIQRSEG